MIFHVRYVLIKDPIMYLCELRNVIWWSILAFLWWSQQ